MNSEQIKQLTRIYKNNPEYFNEEQTSQLAEYAAEAGRPIQRDPAQDEDSTLLRYAQQFADGVIKGGTGIIDPEWGGKPRNSGEEIAKSVGELGGFLGLLFAPVGATVGLLGKSLTAAKMVKTAAYVEKAAAWMKGAAELKSVPVAAGEKMMGWIGVENAAKLAGKFGSRFANPEMATTLAKQFISGGIRMGTAGAVSSFTFGDGRSAGEYVTDAIHGGVYGMIFGGVMDVVPGAIPSLPYFKGSTTADAIIKGIVGAATNAVPSMAGGADMTRVGYEAAVGAFFGSKALKWKEFRAQENLMAHGDAWGFFPEENLEAKRIFKGREEELKQMGEYKRAMHRPDTVRNVLIGLAARYLESTGLPQKVLTPETFNFYINGGFGKHRVGDYIMEEVTGGTRMRIKEIVKDADGYITHYRGVNPNGDTVELPISKAIRDTEEWKTVAERTVVTKQIIENPEWAKQQERFKQNPALAQQEMPVEKEIVVETPASVNVVDTPTENQTTDMEVADDKMLGYYKENGGVNGAVKRVAAKIYGFDDTTSRFDIEGRTGNLLHAVLQTAAEVRDPSKQSRGLDDVLDYIHSLKDNGHANAENITLDDLHEIMPLWNAARESIDIEHRAYVGGKLAKQTRLKNSELSINYKGDAVSNRASRTALHQIAGDDAVIIISGHTKVNEHGREEHVELNEADLTKKDFQKMQAQLHDEGYYLYSAGADKPIFVAVKYIDGGMTDAEVSAKLLQHMQAIQKVKGGENFAKDLDILRAESGYDEATYSRIILNNIMYYERLNGLSHGDAVTPGEFHKAMSAGQVTGLKDQRFIVDAVNFNKRMQPLLTNMYSVDPRALEHFARGKKLNMKAVIVHDSPLKENTDGGTIEDPDNMDAFHGAAGIPFTENHTKSFIYGKADDGKGMYIFKHGKQRATDELAAAMKAAGLGYIARPTGVKQMGNRKVYEVEFDGKELSFYERGADGKRIKDADGNDLKVAYDQLDTIELKPEDMHISSSIHDDIEHHLNGAITFPKQGIYHGSNYESGGISVAAQMKWVLEKFRGDKKMNEALARHVEVLNDSTRPDKLKLMTPEERKKDAEAMSKALNSLLKNFDQIGVKEVLQAMQRNETLRERFTQKIMQALEDAEMVDGEGFVTSMPEGLMDAKRLVGLGGKIPLLYGKPAMKMTEQAITRFITSRLTHPKVRSAGKATMHTFGEDLHRAIGGEDKLTENNFFLDDSYKDLRIKGYVLNEKGNVKKGMVTLEAQFNAFKAQEKIVEADPSNKAASKHLEKMRQALHFVTTRVPMDSFSGMVKLEFAGFTGMKGGSILLHGKTKQQLGGADNDGDTAFFFHGLPKEFHDALDQNRGNFTKYSDHLDARATKAGTDEKRIFFTEGVGIYKDKKNTIAGMLDPMARAIVGHAVSKGRGSMLPQAVRYVDIMKKVLDTAYMKGGVLELKDSEGRKITLEARDYDPNFKNADGTLGKGSGETLGAYGQVAINSAADAGKEAGMVTAEQMKAILTASAFKRITVDGEEIFNADKADFNRGNHAELLKKVAAFIDKKTGYRDTNLFDTEVGKYSDFLTKMFGYNKKMMQPYTLQEIQAAAAAVPDYFETPYRHIIDPMKDIHYSDGLIERIKPKMSRFIEFLKAANKFTGGNALMADGVLPGGVRAEHAYLKKLSDLYMDSYDSSPNAQMKYNLATVQGMEEFAGHEGKFTKYLSELQGMYPRINGDYPEGMKDWQVLQQYEREYGAFWRYDKQVIDEDLDRMKAMLGRVATDEEKAQIRAQARIEPNVVNRVKFLQDQRVRMAHYLGSRIYDVASGALVSRYTRNAGLSQKEIDSDFIANRIGSVLDAQRVADVLDPKGNYKPSLLDLVRLIKYSQDVYRRKDVGDGKSKFGKEIKKVNVTEDGEVKQVPLDAQKAMEFALDYQRHIVRITDGLNAQRKQGEPRIGYRQMEDLYHSLLVSTTLKAGEIGKTGHMKFGLSVVPDHILKEYGRIIDQVYSESQKTEGDYDFKRVFDLVEKAKPKWTFTPRENKNPKLEKRAAEKAAAEKAKETPAAPLPQEAPVPKTIEVETRTVEGEAPAATGQKILQYFSLRMDGIDPQKVATNLSKKEQAMVDALFEYMSKHKSVFGDDMRNFFQMANGLMSGSPHNLNQWSIKDLEGLVTRIKQAEGTGTMLDMITGIFKGGPAWSLWMHLPGVNVKKLTQDPADFYLKKKTVYDAEGKFNPEAKLHEYMSDTGDIHRVYLDEAIPMNTLLSNRDRFAAKNYIASEQLKKAEAILQTHFSWLHGGIVDDLNPKVDHRELIQKIAVYRREYEAAVRGGDQKEIDRKYARMNGEDNKLRDEWEAIKDKQVRITEGGVASTMTGEEAIIKTMGAIEALNKEYSKYIVLDDETLHNFFVTKDVTKYATDAFGTHEYTVKVLDHRATGEKFANLLNAKEFASYDAVNLYNYFRQVDLNVRKLLLKHEKFTSEDVENLKLYDRADEVKAAHPTIRTVSDAHRYLDLYNHFTEYREMPEHKIAFEMKRSKEMVEDAKRNAALDMAADRKNDHTRLMIDLSRYLRADKVSPTDIRARLFGWENYNQYHADREMASGNGGSLTEYYTNKLMHQYQFKETELLDGYFPHRDFDKEVVKKHLARAEKEILEMESMSADDEKHYLNLQYSYRKLLDEDVNPGITDDGDLYDAHLSKDGILPMAHVIGAQPAALKQRTADVEGFSTEPISMLHAIESVINSGQSKLVATLNNDAILKFTDRHMAMSAPKGLVGEALAKWEKERADYTRMWDQYMRQYERQAFNRPSLYTNAMLNDPVTKLKWTPTYWLSDHMLLTKPWTKIHRWYREFTKVDRVTDIEKAIFLKKNGRAMTEQEERLEVKRRMDDALDFSMETKADGSVDYTSKAWKNMEKASKLMKNFSQYEAKFEMATLLFHTRFAINNIYGGVANDYIYNGFAPLRQGRDIKFWNGINNNWKTMDDVYKFFEDAGVIENLILKDTGYTGKNKNVSAVDKVTDKAAFFLKKTEPWLRREAAMHGYIAARESRALLGNVAYDDPYLLSMARKSVEATQFLYDNYNRPAFMSTNLGKVFTRFRLWGMNSLKMQADIVEAASFTGFKKGTVEMERFQRLYWANMFMFGLALMFPHTIFENQLPQPIDGIAQLSGVMFGDDEKNKKKRKNLMTKMEDPIRDMLEIPTKLPGVSFPLARVPMGLYDLPSTFRAIWSHDVHDMATATTLNLFPFGRMAKDVYNAYNSPSMAADIIGGIPIHRIDNFFTKQKRQHMAAEALENLEAEKSLDDDGGDDELSQMLHAR